MNHLPIEIMNEYQRDWLKEADYQRLVKQAVRILPNQKAPVWRLMMLALANGMIRLGLALKAHAKCRRSLPAHPYRFHRL